MEIQNNSNGQKTIKMDLYRAIGILTILFLGTIGTTAYTTYNLLASDHFKIIANETAIKEIKTELGHINSKLDYIIDLHVQR